MCYWKAILKYRGGGTPPSHNPSGGCKGPAAPESIGYRRVNKDKDQCLIPRFTTITESNFNMNSRLVPLLMTVENSTKLCYNLSFMCICLCQVKTCWKKASKAKIRKHFLWWTWTRHLTSMSGNVNKVEYVKTCSWIYIYKYKTIQSD